MHAHTHTERVGGRRGGREGREEGKREKEEMDTHPQMTRTQELHSYNLRN